jgi:hypothetical protein
MNFKNYLNFNTNSSNSIRRVDIYPKRNNFVSRGKIRSDSQPSLKNLKEKSYMRNTRSSKIRSSLVGKGNKLGFFARRSTYGGVGGCVKSKPTPTPRFNKHLAPPNKIQKVQIMDNAAETRANSQHSKAKRPRSFRSNALKDVVHRRSILNSKKNLQRMNKYRTPQARHKRTHSSIVNSSNNSSKSNILHSRSISEAKKVIFSEPVKKFKIKEYHAETTQGNFRNYNEDRVSIILNIVKHSDKKTVGHHPKVDKENLNPNLAQRK